MFYFVVRHLRWAARLPGLAQLFDGLLTATTCFLHPARLVAMEALEQEALCLPGLRLKVHRFGGIEFVADGRELGHLHGHGLLDVAVGRESTETLFAQGKVRRHHVFPNSKWISFQVESLTDVPFALELLTSARR